jgi:hypothetical protein
VKRVTLDVYAEPSDAIGWLAEHFAANRWSRAEAQAVRDFIDLVLWEGPKANRKQQERWRIEDASLVILSNSAAKGALLRETRKTIDKVFEPNDREHFADAARQLRRIADMLDAKAAEQEVE